MSIETLREEIDGIDKELLALFASRMELSKEIGAIKDAEGLPVLDRRREQAKMNAVREAAPEQLEAYVHSLYDLLFTLSRDYQLASRPKHSTLYEEIQKALGDTPPLFPPKATVACQGVEGAYSEMAAKRLFSSPATLYFKSFENVFSAVQSGLCRYGVLPIENSTAGSVNQIYDLMMKYRFTVVRSVRLKVDHSFLVPAGVRREDVKEIFSHEQALSQCSAFLEGLGADVTITRVENTAAAAEAVAKSDRTDVAAIASRSCAGLYGLTALERDIQDRSNNYTRFICISKTLEVYPGADRTGIMMVLPHEPGALYKVLARFAALGINMHKLESRPIPDRDFEFMFYFDLETSVYSDTFARLMDGLKEICEEFQYLGSYTEVI